MILLVLGLGLLGVAAALYTVHRARLARWTGPRACGGCKHALAPGQDVCPECGRAWTNADPGAARVFGDVADRCERVRRAVVVSLWALVLPGAAVLAMSAAYLSGVLPWSVPTNAWWAAPVQTAQQGEPWGPQDVELLVLVRGVVDSPADFGPGSPMARVDEVRIARMSSYERTVPDGNIMEPLLGEMGASFRRSGDGWSALGVSPLEGAGTSMPLAVSFSNDFVIAALADPEHARVWWAEQVLLNAFHMVPLRSLKESGTIDTGLVLRALGGVDLRPNIVWGEKHSGYTPPEIAVRDESTRQQWTVAWIAAIAALLVVVPAWFAAWRRGATSQRSLRPPQSPSPRTASP
ncbi:MAG: hypothetical protein JNK53_07025 [Phycisphaerae bacterium]|nr:hypothetical protein [Phycisphaerae bacterium]